MTSKVISAEETVLSKNKSIVLTSKTIQLIKPMGHQVYITTIPFSVVQDSLDYQFD